MNNKFNDFFKNAFGKDRDEQAHARAMLLIYGVFMLIVVLFIRLSPAPKNVDSNNENNQVVDDNNITTTPTPTASLNPEPTPTANTEKKKIEYEINYAYSYTINHDGNTEVYIGKRLDDKQKFSYIKDGKTTEYAIMDDNYLIKENGVYHIIDKLGNYFKYCDVEKILKLVEKKKPVSENKFIVTNLELKEAFGVVGVSNSLENTIQFEIVDGNIKSIELDLSNFIVGVDNFNIKMEFADVGNVEDFEIKMN